jgi:hypothetical protein
MLLLVVLPRCCQIACTPSMSTCRCCRCRVTFLLPRTPPPAAAGRQPLRLLLLLLLLLLGAWPAAAW